MFLAERKVPPLAGRGIEVLRAGDGSVFTTDGNRGSGRGWVWECVL